MMKAKEYEFDYWDGDRRYGYGGYRYIEGRWKPAAQALIDIYGLKGDAKILDVGCGKAHLLYELKRLLPGRPDCRLRFFTAWTGRSKGGDRRSSLPLQSAGYIPIR